MKNPFRSGRQARPPELPDTALEAARGRLLVEESREIVVVLDAERRVISASRRARDAGITRRLQVDTSN